MAEPGGWDPDVAAVAHADITRYTDWLRDTERGDFSDYRSLWEASVSDVNWFWGTMWDFFDIGSLAGEPPTEVLSTAAMPGATWFPGATLNYVSQVFRHADQGRPAVVAVGEDGTTEWSRTRLRTETAAFAHYLRSVGVQPGDRVVGYLPSVGETVVAFLAAASIGATWAVCNPDLAVDGVIARLGQLEPTVLVATDGSVYGGKRHDKRAELTEIRRRLPTLTATVVVPRLGLELPDDVVAWTDAVSAEVALEILDVAFDHPLWVLFSSGTTGTPKGIVHGHGGVLLEHLKYLSLQLDLHPEDRFLWYSTTSWMMWNFVVGGLLVGSTIVVYDGSPTHPRSDSLWQIVADHHVTVFGTGAGYLLSCAKEELRPGEQYDLTALRGVGSTGSPLPASGFRWVQDGVGRPIPVQSCSGGTDVVTAFIGPAPTVPVVAGEISCPALGVAVEAWTEKGTPVIGEAAELVITKPMPSMPVFFWNDPDGSRYRATYFDKYPGVWCHGDWLTITERGSVIVHGRSDATLNRHGIRMGSAEIYNAVENMPEIRDCVVIGAEKDDGGYWMPLFVALADGVELDDDLRARITGAIRTHASPRHVPDDIIAVPGIPLTITGKRVEIPIKRILLGADPADVVSPEAIDHPEFLAAFTEYAAT